MSRTVSGEANKVTGAKLVHLLEIKWGAPFGTKYFSDRPLTTPVVAEAKVLSWGSITLEAEPDRIGGYADTTIELIDTDLSIKEMFDTLPGPAAKTATVYTFFEGGTWPGDAVVVFSGMINGDVEFDTSTGVWKVSMKGLEKRFDKTLGVPLTRENFPTIKCTDHEGKIIPIVYGDTVKRVPGRLIQMPGHAYLAAPFLEHDTSIELTMTAEEMGIEPATEVTLTLGTPDFWEKVTGTFSSADSTTFNVTSRGTILATGQSPGTYGYQSGRYFLIDSDDLPEGTGSLIGYPIWIQTTLGQWGPAWVIDNWIESGSNIAVVRQPVNGPTFGTGQLWKIGAIPGLIVRWPVSTPVYGPGGWVYAVSHLPSASLDAVIVRAQMQGAGNSRGQWRYYKMHESRYFANLNDKSFNDKLGRGEDDDGITTITIYESPAVYGFEDQIYATLSGPSGLKYPDEIINHMLTHSAMGNIPSEHVNVTAMSDVELSFAITEEMSLHDAVSQLAYQGCCLYFWDQGVARLRALSNTLSGADSTLDESSIAERTLTIGHSDMEAAYTSALGKFRPTCVSNEVKFYRKSTAAEQYYGERRKEIDFWGIQDPDQIVKSLEFWLAYYLNKQRTLKLECFLDKGLKLQPGDVINVSLGTGTDASPIDEQKARVTRVQQMFGDTRNGEMERIAVEAEFSVWNLAIDSTTPDPQLCQGEGGDELEQPNQADDAGTGGAGGYGDQFGGINFWINFYNTFGGGGGPGGPGGPGFPMNPNEQYGTCVEFEYVTEVGRCEYKTEKIRVFGCPCEDDEGETGT